GLDWKAAPAKSASPALPSTAWPSLSTMAAPLATTLAQSTRRRLSNSDRPPPQIWLSSFSLFNLLTHLTQPPPWVPVPPSQAAWTLAFCGFTPSQWPSHGVPGSSQRRLHAHTISGDEWRIGGLNELKIK